MQARNIAEGTPYRTTNFIANPANTIHPALYPAGLPLLLAPVFRAFGPDLERLKWVGILCIGLWLCLFVWIGRGFLPDGLALAAAGLAALHPYLWRIKDNIWSEFPFILFAYSTLLLTEKILERDDRLARSLPLALLLGVSLAAAFLTRTIGVVLFPVILVTALWRWRRVHAGTMAALLVSGAIILGVQHWFPSDSGTYVSIADGFTVKALLETVSAYRWAAFDLVQPQLFRLPMLAWLAVAAFFGLAILGYVSRLRSKVTVYEVFLPVFLGAILLYPSHGEVDRYTLPLWPLVLLYAVCGCRAIAGRLPVGRWQMLLPAGMIAWLGCTTAYTYSKLDFGRIQESVTNPLSRQMFDAVQAYVPRDAVVLARKPTYIGLFANRRASTWPEPFETRKFWEYARSIGATYLVQDYPVFDSSWPDHIVEFVAANGGRLTRVFHNQWFSLYRMDVPGPEGLQSP